MTATQWQARETELLAQLRANELEFEAFRQRVARMLRLAEDELNDIDHQRCADLVYAIGVGIHVNLGSTP